MTQLKNRGSNTRNWVALGALVLAAVASGTACGGGEGGVDRDGSGGAGANNAGGAGANDGTGGDGASDGSGGGGIDPDATVGQVRMAPCGKDMANLQAETYEATGWKAETECQPAFVSKWDTAQPGVSSNTEIRLPLVEVGTYDFWIDWGDSKISHITKWDADAITHSYAKKGEYDVQVVGVWEGFRFGVEKTLLGKVGAADAEKILEVSQWGALVFGPVDGHFYGAKNLRVTASDAPDLSKTTSLAYSFRKAESVTEGLENWDTSTITSLEWVFGPAINFNSDISAWDTSNVTSMFGSFDGATAFNQDIGGWNTSKVTDMGQMFGGATSFDQNLDRWDTSQVIQIGGMFLDASSFNGKIGTWDTSGVEYFTRMFEGATVFNQDIGAWDTSKALSMWQMFQDADAFNQDIGGWDISKVETMEGMFQSAGVFNQDLSAWNVSNVNNMADMFAAAAFFDQDISGWNIDKVTDMEFMLSWSGLSIVNYGKLLTAWALRSGIQRNVSFGAKGLKYSVAVQPARDALTGGTNNWVIDGDSCSDCP